MAYCAQKKTYTHISNFRSQAMDVPKDFKDTEDEKVQKLERLKNEIRQQEKHPVKEYASLEDLGNRVEQDFKALVDRIFPQGELSPVEKERLQHKV